LCYVDDCISQGWIQRDSWIICRQFTHWRTELWRNRKHDTSALTFGYMNLLTVKRLGWFLQTHSSNVQFSVSNVNSHKSASNWRRKEYHFSFRTQTWVGCFAWTGQKASKLICQFDVSSWDGSTLLLESICWLGSRLVPERDIWNRCFIYLPISNNIINHLWCLIGRSPA
jgi:hypothetical protein